MVMRKLLKMADGKIFDVAAAPIFLILFGVPALLIVGVLVLVYYTIKLIKRARSKNVKKEGKPENSDSSEENQ